MEGLNRTIMVGVLDFNRNGQGLIQEVQRYLVRRYGGPPKQYTAKRVYRNTYAIQLPPGEDKDRVVAQANIWGTMAGWEITPWDVERTAFLQPDRFKVYIRITNFPFEFWNPFFVHLVVAQFGDAEQIDSDNMWGDDRSAIAISLLCLDPKRIPFSSQIPFGTEFWKECFIEIV